MKVVPAKREAISTFQNPEDEAYKILRTRAGALFSFAG